MNELEYLRQFHMFSHETYQKPPEPVQQKMSYDADYNIIIVDPIGETLPVMRRSEM